MTSSSGDWVAVPIAGEPDRWDWVPAEQPGSPDGTPGTWHVIGGSGPKAGKWEWYPIAPGAPTPPPPSAPAPALSEQVTEPVSKAAPMPWDVEEPKPWESEAPKSWESTTPMPAAETPAASSPIYEAPAPTYQAGAYPPPAPESAAFGAPVSAAPGPWQPAQPSVGAAGWHAAPPVMLAPRKRSLKVPLAIVGGIVVIALIGVGALVLLSGGDDGKKKEDLTALANFVVTADSGKDVCSSHLTTDFVQNVFGSLDSCEEDDGSSDDESANATGATVTNFVFDKDTATATVTVNGGDANGTTGTWAFAQGEDKTWRVAEWRADYLRSNFQKAFGDNYKADGSDDPFSDSGLRGCVTGKALALDDAAFLNFAHQQFRGSDDATKEMLGFMSDCPSDTAGVSALRALFEKGFRSSVSTSLPPDTTDCIVNGLRTSLSDEDIKELSINADQPHPDLEARVQQTTIGCAGAGTTVDPTTPQFQEQTPGFGI